MNSSVYEKVRAILVTAMGVDSAIVTPDAKLMHDLRLFGDDADDFLGRLQAEFSTDFSSLEFSRYFYEESNTLNLMLFCGWYRRRKLALKPPISVSHLCHVIEKGSWVDPPADQ